MRIRHKQALATEETAHFCIDAICINQGNVAERNQQVKLMKSVYSRAKQVQVWIGLSKAMAD